MEFRNPVSGPHGRAPPIERSANIDEEWQALIKYLNPGAQIQ